MFITHSGIGLVSFPFAFVKTGIIPGMLLIFCIASLEVFTGFILCYYAARFRAKTYQDLVFKSLGPTIYRFCIAGLVGFLFGCMVIYFMCVHFSKCPEKCDHECLELKKDMLVCECLEHQICLILI